jgi:hypothetical protein
LQKQYDLEVIFPDKKENNSRAGLIPAVALKGNRKNETFVEVSIVTYSRAAN